MREAAGHFAGTAWTPVAKGAPEPNESDEECALREVREEMGVEGVIVSELSGYFLGTTTATRLYVMRAAGPVGPHDAETASVQWVTIDEARELVALSASAIVRARDLAVLDALASVL